MSNVAQSFSEILKPAQVSTEPAELENYGRDWTRVFTPKASVILFPESTDDVVKIVKLAHSRKIALVPSGGRTGLSGGAVAHSGEAVVSLQRMNRILEMNE